MSQAMNMMTDMAMQGMRQNNLDAERSRLDNIANSQDKALKEKELRKAAEGFEAIFIQKMWDEMRSSLPKNGMHYSKEEEYWQSMYSQELGKSMASAGGIGLADMMVEQLTRPTNTSPQTGALSRIRMAVSPAPLVPSAQTAKTNPVQNTANVQNIQNTQSAQPFQTAQNTQNTAGAGMPGTSMYEEYKPQTANAAAPAQNREQQPVQAVQAEQEQPQYIRRTYVTNLPPEKRQHALIGKNGKPTRQTVRTVDVKVPNTEEYIDRSQSIGRKAKVAQPQPQAPQQEQDYPSYNPVPAQQAQPAPQPKAEPQDLLAGISTSYIPQAQRIAMIKASERFKTDALRQSTEALVAQADIRQNTEQAKKSDPKLLSLEQALKLGTLVASLNPDEIQELQKKNQAPHLTIGGGSMHAATPNTVPQTMVSALAPHTDFAMPVNGQITSSFGWRLDPLNQKRAWHTGIDIRAEQGSIVKAGKAGTVKYAGTDPELGNVVIIDHGMGIESVYGHNSELLVKAGDKIEFGTHIAKVGTSGRTNGSHLHFEIRQNGLSINPEPFFSKEEIS